MLPDFVLFNKFKSVNLLVAFQIYAFSLYIAHFRYNFVKFFLRCESSECKKWEFFSVKSSTQKADEQKQFSIF